MPPKRINKNLPLLQVLDPDGKTITLHKNTYEKHISVNHPEVELPKIRSTLEAPDAILQSAHTETTDIYSSSSILSSGLFMNVFVGFEQSDSSGIVKSAYITSRLPKGKIKKLNKKHKI